MCTFNLTLSEDLVKLVRPGFPSQEAMVEYAQKQFEGIFIKFASQRRVKESKVKSIDQLSPEMQALLTATAPLAGTVPDWDLNGDVAKNEALKEKYGY